jgi:hypothetical protein
MRKSAALLFFVLAIPACGKGERPFRMVQFCLGDIGQIATMNSVLREVASANRLPFFDNSKATEADLNSASEIQHNLPVAHPTVNVGTVGPDAMGFSAGNFAEAPSQIVVGFSNGGDSAKARKLSDDVVQALSKRWRIREVLDVETTGAFPLKDCNG